MFGLPALVAGLILLTAGGGWFEGARAVGVVLTSVGGIIVAMLILASIDAAKRL